MLKIVIGYGLDLLFGDPYWLPHPIRFIGNGIKATENMLRRFFKGEKQERVGGIFLTIIIVFLAYGLTYLLMYGAEKVHPYLKLGLETFLIFQILATKSLDRESRKVYTQLQQENLPEARKYLSYIVGRETKDLNEQEIARGAIETVAENISDGIIAPLFYICIGGAPLGMAYKAINTLDSMVGYKNEKYLNFGRASARLDDFVNYIPARLTAFFIIIASAFTGYDWKNGYRITKRDCRNHKSPNSGYPESAVAGALGIQIGGTNTYFGEKVYKPTIGEPIRQLEKEDIQRTIEIMYATSLTGMFCFMMIKYLLIVI
ncbi:adenosylcobinamide-phosphate synthase [Anaerosolibacter carboniphilus]|uniref:Cobalamin biosynthesis protein CobD n=1 Tax=Anaerosolibacter carboniphilus TaxID=1417629 RepID=A0A841KWQ2_9FIRM|nr:adenosylcobinamide-phosphate synthase CbiB [Anaerosolibacter carboniphilus]MBB6214605.1 adenosylcobinamide-phosphate synthase [Anaerosolibacter carboniphilus]